MGDNVPTNPVVIPSNLGEEELIRRQIIGRGFRAINYISIYVFIFVVYGGALFTDYGLFSLMWWLLSEDVKQYGIISLLFDYTRIGLALLFIATAIIHGVISTYSQIKLDITLMHEDEKKYEASIHSK